MPDGVPAWDWKLAFRVGVKEVAFEQAGGVLPQEVKKLDDTHVEVFFDNHGFGCGTLIVEFSEAVPDSDYGDGYKNVHTPQVLPVVLWSRASDDTAPLGVTLQSSLDSAVANAVGKTKPLKIKAHYVMNGLNSGPGWVYVDEADVEAIAKQETANTILVMTAPEGNVVELAQESCEDVTTDDGSLVNRQLTYQLRNDSFTGSTACSVVVTITTAMADNVYEINANVRDRYCTYFNEQGNDMYAGQPVTEKAMAEALQKRNGKKLWIVIRLKNNDDTEIESVSAALYNANHTYDGIRDSLLYYIDSINLSVQRYYGTNLRKEACAAYYVGNGNYIIKCISDDFDIRIDNSFSGKGKVVASMKKSLATTVSEHTADTENPHKVTKEQLGLENVTNDAQVKREELGVTVATLDGGKIPAAQLPSYVDDVLEYDSLGAFPGTGESGKIYVATDTDLTYRWSGTGYVEISKSLALGETASTAYAGDKGKKLAEDMTELVKNVGGELEQVSDGIETLTAGLNSLATSKVDKVEGKQLSTNDYTDADKEKLEKLQLLTEEEIENLYSYGVEFDVTIQSPICTRIGNMNKHKTLPIQSKMRGCLLNDSGGVNKYLSENSWIGEVRDGSQGQVEVEIPSHYRKCKTDGNKRIVRLSEIPLPGYELVPLMYVSAYEATVQRSTNKLCSVVNDDVDYRGGNNQSSNDAKSNTLLGRPATSINRTNFRNYARKRKAGSTEWNCMTYDAQKALYWLFVVEYATLNSQATYNSEPTAEGFRQGGLGAGVTTFGSDWNTFNGYYPFVPCGLTDSLGNRTGVVEYTVKNDAESNPITKTFQVPRYRGVENPFGHIWQWTDGINVRISPNTDKGGDGLSKVFVCSDPSKFNDSNYEGYSHVGNEARTESYVKEVIFGEGGEIMPKVVGGGSTTYFCDYHYTNIPTTETLRGVLFGGYASDGASAGFAFAYSNRAPSSADVSFGSRLCFIPATT